MADQLTPTTKRPMALVESMAVMSYVQDKLMREYAGKPTPDEGTQKKLIAAEVEAVTGVKPNPELLLPREVASTHEEKLKKVILEQNAKYPNGMPQQSTVPVPELPAGIQLPKTGQSR